jgi:hypothetical protein
MISAMVIHSSIDDPQGASESFLDVGVWVVVDRVGAMTPSRPFCACGVPIGS